LLFFNSPGSRNLIKQETSLIVSIYLDVGLLLSIFFRLSHSANETLDHKPEPEQIENLKDTQEGKENFDNTLGRVVACGLGLIPDLGHKVHWEKPEAEVNPA